MSEVEALACAIVRASGRDPHQVDYIGDPSVPNGTRSFEAWEEEADFAAKILAELRPKPTGAIDDIISERRRQIEKEGWSPEHDDQHRNFEMSAAAGCYALLHYGGLPMMSVGPLAGSTGSVPVSWPWDTKWWKPQGARRDLVRAAALIVAEIERLDRGSP